MEDNTVIVELISPTNGLNKSYMTDKLQDFDMGGTDQLQETVNFLIETSESQKEKRKELSDRFDTVIADMDSLQIEFEEMKKEYHELRPVNSSTEKLAELLAETLERR